VFTVAAGILPAVEPGILPGGNGRCSREALAVWRLQPGGKLPPSTAAKLAAATYLLRTVNTYNRGKRYGRVWRSPWERRQRRGAARAVLGAPSVRKSAADGGALRTSVSEKVRS